MDRFLGIAVCLSVTFMGTEAIKCYTQYEIHCSGDSPCDTVQELLPPGRTETECQDGTTMCALSFASVSAEGITVTSRFGNCADNPPTELETGCYGLDELEEMVPTFKKKLEDTKKPYGRLGMKSDQVQRGLCVCDTNLCNDVTRPAINIAVIVASFIVTIVSMLS